MKAITPAYRYLLLVICSVVCMNISAQDLLLINATIVDPRSEQIRQGNLQIEDGLIIAETKTIPEHFSGKVLDLKGKWIMPSLNEMHTHSGGNRAPGGISEHFGTLGTAQLLLSVGITSMLDLFGDEQALQVQRRLQRDGKVGGADLFTSLSCLTASKGHCTEYGIDTRTMDSPSEATAVVNSLAKQGPDVIKIVYTKDGRMPSIDYGTLLAAVTAAKSNGLKSVVHINSIADIKDVVKAQADAITHLPSDEELTADIAALIAQNNIVFIPTVVSDTDYVSFVDQPSLLQTPMARYLVSDKIRQAYSLVEVEPTRLEQLKQKNQRFYRSLKTLADAGVSLLAGSDTGGAGTVQGYSLHRELIKFVDSGLSNWQALAAATTTAGDFLGKRFGVQAGDEANLIVLEASPIDDIRNSQKVELVIHHGRIFESYMSH